MRIQHLLDATIGNTAPAANDCLASLTRWTNCLLAGQLDRRLSPWLCGAPLTALLKPSGGVRPIAVGETLRRLTSRLCCTAARPSLPNLFLPSGQVGVGINSGLEAAIHTLRLFLKRHGGDEDLCCLKLDMHNAFNECHRSAFLHRLRRDLPEIVAWVQWCYSSAAELHFGVHRILSTAGVQQGDPLGPLLFSLTLLELLDAIGPVEGLSLQLWYLDDGTVVGTRAAVRRFLELLLEKGPQFGLFVNLEKTELFWPSGDQLYPDFPVTIRRINASSDGVTLLGSPTWGPDEFFRNFVRQHINKVLESQARLMDLENPQVALHLLRSCLGLCKLNHLQCTVPTSIVSDLWRHFDDGLRHSLGSITQSSISDAAWQQASLPVRYGGLGLRTALPSAPAAFLGICNASRLLCEGFLASDALHSPATPEL